MDKNTSHRPSWHLTVIVDSSLRLPRARPLLRLAGSARARKRQTSQQRKMLHLLTKLLYCLARATLCLSDTLMKLVLHAVILGMSMFPLLALKR